MAWVRLEDSFYDHPKMRAAGPLGRDMWVQALGYCNKHLTDGYVPFDMIPVFGEYRSFNDYIRSSTGKTKWAGFDPYDTAHKLCEVGLWVAAEGGFIVTGYHEFQPSKEQVLTERAAAADRKKAWRERQRDGDGTRRATRDSAVRNASPTRPDPARPEGSRAGVSAEPSARVSAPAPSGGADEPEVDTSLPAEQVERNTSNVRELHARLKGDSAA